MPKLSLAKLERHLYSAADRLRQEGLDAAIYKDYIFGLLFLKRSSDVFETERERVAERNLENPDFYNTFFVPERARWSYLQSRLADGTVTYGSLLDTALGALSEANEELEHVLDHISFMRMQGNKRVVSDDACKDLVRHFSKYQLRNEDFQFSDLLGAAYEFLINMFAESAGKKGGDFYTPRDVIRLMVRILKPQPGLSVYDPTCGSGGMLIISREYIEQSGGDPTNLRLCGQVNDASAWSICKLNMLLHGLPGADIQLQDTLLHPMHREGGELERFDRVIANPPFSQNYTRSGMEFPERFRWGWCPTTGKKADLMFAQHMLAVCKDGGMATTVMPHGVLFRGGAEKEIRQKFLQEDLIEAIIGLPENLFYGASIPACIFVMRPNLSRRSPNQNKPPERRGRVLFINADAEYYAGRAQNYLRPEHVEKIVSTFERYEDVPGYARCVPISEISDVANDWNLNIRRYVDNSPPPEPHDVRAHLFGGVPLAEVEAKRPLFRAIRFDSARAFVNREHEGAYVDFGPTLNDRTVIRPLVEGDSEVQHYSQVSQASLTAWWTEHASRLAELPARRDLNAVRSEILNSFVDAMLSLGNLDRFKLSGVIATWWTDTLPDCKTLVENGFSGVVDGWVDAIADAVNDEEDASPTFDPFGHRLVRRIMTDYLEQIGSAHSEIARLRGEKEAFEQSNAPDDLNEEELADWNYPKDLEAQARDIKAQNNELFRALKKLESAAVKSRASAKDKQDASDARAAATPVFEKLASIAQALLPYEKVKAELSQARTVYQDLTSRFVEELRARCSVMSEEQKRDLVLDLFADDLKTALKSAMGEKCLELVSFLESLWEKYFTPLSRIKGQQESVAAEFSRMVSVIGYGH